MNDLAQTWLAHLLLAHKTLTLTLLITLPLTVVGARLLAPRIPIPPANAPWWERSLHFLLINWPSWGDSLEGEIKTLIPGFAPPFLSFTSRPADDAGAADKAREVFNEKKPGDAGVINVSIMMCIGAIGLIVAVVLAGGCAGNQSYVRALQIKGELSDGALAAHNGWRTFDSGYHDKLIAEAPTFAEGMARLRAWQQGNEKRVDDALRAWRDANKSYREALRTAGAAKRSDWKAVIVPTVSAAAAAIAVLADIGMPVDWSLPPIPEIPGLPTVSLVPSLALMPMGALERPSLCRGAGEFVWLRPEASGGIYTCGVPVTRSGGGQ